MPPKEKKDLIEALIEGDIDIGDGPDNGEKWADCEDATVFQTRGVQRAAWGLRLGLRQ